MAKTIRELHKNNPNHQPCDFGLTKFNLTKRSKEFVDDANAASTKAKGKPDRIAPSIPTGLSITATLSSLTLAWSASTDNVAVTGYRVYKNGVFVADLTRSILQYEFTGLDEGTTYLLAVAAFDAAGNVSVATSIQGATLGTTTTTTSTSTTTTTTSESTTTTTTSGSTTTTTTSASDVQAPSMPIITSISSTSTTLTVNYQAAADNVGVVGYIVGVDSAVYGTASTSYTFTGLVPGTTYSVTVTAYDAAGNYSVTATTYGTTMNVVVTPSAAVIYCDFNGQTVSGTMWNTNGNIVCAPSGLTFDEQDIVLNEIKAVYAAYNITVTDDETVYNAANPTKRMRVIFTQSWEWYGQAGGVAYINSFGWGDGTPCFVFTSLLGYNVRYIWAAGAHEAGHTLGLRHQSSYNSSCVKTAEYNAGNGVNSPIMGVGYYLPPIWWIGPNSLCCTCTQNDNQILIDKLGLK